MTNESAPRPSRSAASIWPMRWRGWPVPELRFMSSRTASGLLSRPSPPLIVGLPSHGQITRRDETRQGPVGQIADYHTRRTARFLHEARGVNSNHQGAGRNALAIAIIRHPFDDRMQAGAAFGPKEKLQTILALQSGQRCRRGSKDAKLGCWALDGLEKLLHLARHVRGPH